MWIYSQGLGTLYRKRSPIDQPSVEGQGYAGFGKGVNNPVTQCLEDFGPIPRGQYTISDPIASPTQFSLPLIPAIANDMCNPPRSNFLIHGDRKLPRPPDTASQGCIILALDVRKKIWESGDRDLTVVEYGP
ncbi:tlde1 domain-containing protein [Mesorhizobium sp. C399B]